MEVAFIVLEALQEETQAKIKNSVHKGFGGIKRRNLPKSSTCLPFALSWSGLLAVPVSPSTVHGRAAVTNVPWRNVCHDVQCSLTLN